MKAENLKGQLLTTRGAARILELGNGMVRYLETQGKLESIRVDDGGADSSTIRLFLRADVLALARARAATRAKAKAKAGKTAKRK